MRSRTQHLDTSTPGHSAERPRRVLYGRRSSHKLSEPQRAAMASVLPRLAVPAGPLAAPAALFAPETAEIWLEIGAGGGEHALALAAAHPHAGIIACEPFVNGMARLVAALADHDPGNLRLHMGDARDLIEALPPATLARVFVLFPDPWPKTRHVKRRLFQPEVLEALARTMRPGGEIRLASDQDAYVAWAEAAIAGHGAFALDAHVRSRPADWPATRYEQKALRAGRSASYLRFLRHRQD